MTHKNENESIVNYILLNILYLYWLSIKLPQNSVQMCTNLLNENSNHTR